MKYFYTSKSFWFAFRCGNINWARRNTCNVCNAPKIGPEETRTGKLNSRLNFLFFYKCYFLLFTLGFFALIKMVILQYRDSNVGKKVIRLLMLEMARWRSFYQKPNRFLSLPKILTEDNLLSNSNVIISLSSVPLFCIFN